MHKKVCLFLAILLTASACISCSTQKAETIDTSVSISENADIETTEETKQDHLPDNMDLQGRTMCFLAQTEDFATNEILVEELTGEGINDAVFMRNSNVCQRLNVSIEQELISSGAHNEATKKLTNLVSAGSDDFDLFCSNVGHTSSAAANGMFNELTKLTYLELTQPYWSQGFNMNASIGGKQYICTGPMALGFYRYLMVGLFNKSMFDRYGIAYPYETVLAGTWTMEVQNALAEQFYVDTNGDNKQDETDTYGFYTRANTDTAINDGYWASLNLRAITKDEKDAYVYNIDIENFVNGLDKVLILINGNGTYKNSTNDDAIYKHFAEGKAAMINARLHKVEENVLREMEDEYGILPLPKADETQDSYYSLAQDQFLVYGIPLSVDVSGLEDIGMFLEAYASESYKVVQPAYYETALTSKYINDQESVAMLDIIVENLYIEPTIMYISSFSFNVMTMREILRDGENTIASKIAANQSAMNKAVEELNAFYFEE